MRNEVQQIKKRNQRVETDKAWETSKTRKLIIAILTYIVVVIFLIIIKIPHPELNALIPVAGFLLSTMTLGFFKKIWITKIYKK